MSLWYWVWSSSPNPVKAPWSVTPGSGVTGTQFVPFHEGTCPVVAADWFIADKLWLWELFAFPSNALCKSVWFIKDPVIAPHTADDPAISI